MSKILLTADLHFGLHGKTEDILTSLLATRKYAAERGISKIFVLGDLVHDREKLDLLVGKKIYDFMKSCKNEFGQEWLVFPGNHDMYYKYNWKITALDMFRDVMTVVDEISRVECYGRNFWVIPFIAVEKVYLDICQQIDLSVSKRDVILTHIGCMGATMNFSFLFREQKAINFDNRLIGRAYTGHFHCHHKVGTKTWYTGSPIPFNFDEGMVPHGFLEYDCVNGTHEFVDLYPLMQKLGMGRSVPPRMPTIDANHIKDIPEHSIKGESYRLVYEERTSEEIMRKNKLFLKSRGANKISTLCLADRLAPEKTINIATGTERISFRQMFENYHSNDKSAKDFDVKEIRKMNNEIIQRGDLKYSIEVESEA